MRRFVRELACERGKNFQRQLHRLRLAPHDEEALHDLRVANRRFVQCLRTFKKSFDKDEAKKLRRNLRRLMRHCGDVRDRDIAIRLLADAGVRAPALVVDLATERVERQKRLVAELERWRGKRSFKLKVRRIAGSVAGYKQRELPRLAKRWREAGDEAVTSESYETLHRFRILSKQYRYTLEMFSAPEQRIEQLRKVQDHLGAINDCVATQLLIRGHAQAKAAIADLLKAREREFQAFWKQFRRTRQDGTLHIAARRSGAA